MLRTIFLSLLAIAALTGCSQSSIGLFQSIELERKVIDDRTLENDLVVGAVSKTGATPIAVLYPNGDPVLDEDVYPGLDADADNDALTEPGDIYFIAAGSLWFRRVHDASYPDEIAQWEDVDAPGSTNATATSLVLFSGSGAEVVYAVYSSQDGTESGVYPISVTSYHTVTGGNALPERYEIANRYEPDPNDPEPELAKELILEPQVTVGASVFGTDATAVAGLGRLFVANDGVAGAQLLIVAKDTAAADTAPTYSLYASADGADGSFTQVAGTVGNRPVIDVAQTSGGDVIYLTRKEILVDAGGINTAPDPVDVAGNINLLIPDSDPAEYRQPEFGGVHYLEGTPGTLIVTDDEGYIYRSEDLGASWTANATAYEVSTTDDSALQFTDVTALDNGGTELLVVGTQAHGYRELDSAFIPTTPSAEESNYAASELAKATIITFYVQPTATAYVPAPSGETYELKTGDLLFAGTSNLGLWKVLYTGDAPQWIRE